MLTIIGAWFGGIWGRIGGWIVAGLSVLALLKWRDWSAREQGRAEAETATREATLKKREQMAAVQKPGDAEVDEALRKGKF